MVASDRIPIQISLNKKGIVLPIVKSPLVEQDLEAYLNLGA